MFKPELWQSHDEYRTRVTTLGRKLSRKLVDDDTTTLCKAGHKLCPWGNDPIKNTHKYRCSLKYGRITSCPHAEECSPRNYGRTVSIKNHNNLRFQPRIPRDLNLCQYFGQKKLKDYDDFLSSSSSFCCGVR